MSYMTNDTCVIYDTCMWRKPTNTGLLLNFHSMCPTTWKSGLIKCFLHRGKYICSNYSLYKQEIEKLRMLFQKNAYPNWFINKIITKFKNNNFNNTNDCNFSNTQEIEKEFAFTFGIPYIGKPSRTFSKKLRALIKNKFNVNMNIYFRSFKVGNYFQLKCSTLTELSSNVVYKFSCPCDTAISYIGRAAITSLFLRFVLILKVCVLENIFVLISKICPYFDLCPYFCFILLVEVLTTGI